tara:strand:- start:37 stop:255 length:219 start_codon:yes stop_codon:yes gene_type:complete
MGKQKKSTMPPLTIDGKRQLIKQAIYIHGKKNTEKWLLNHNVQSIQQALESVRKLKPKFFYELFEWCEIKNV